MTPSEFRALLASLGMTQVEAARVLGVDERTTRRWASGDREIPPPVAKLLRLLDQKKLTADDVRAA